jgi:hypothetical protein
MDETEQLPGVAISCKQVGESEGIYKQVMLVLRDLSTITAGGTKVLRDLGSAEALCSI